MRILKSLAGDDLLGLDRRAGVRRRRRQRRGRGRYRRLARLHRARRKRQSYDWVTEFEKKTGCKVNVKTAGTSDEMVALMNEGGFDLVTASGDASLAPRRGQAGSGDQYRR